MPPRQCEAPLHSGDRCAVTAYPGSLYCRVHGGMRKPWPALAPSGDREEEFVEAVTAAMLAQTEAVLDELFGRQPQRLRARLRRAWRAFWAPA